MWRLGFFFHEIAFGLLSVFIPLYVVSFQDASILGGPLVALGIMSSAAILCTIPASFFWGYICDKTRRYKMFILLSFLSSAVILFLLTLSFAQNILTFVILYVIMQVLHSAHEAPKNVLIAEHYSRNEWEGSYALYEGLTEIGFVIGLVIGLFAFASALSFGVIATYTLYLCSALSVAAFIFSVFLIADPLIIFERRLVGIEKKIGFACNGVEAANRLWHGLQPDGSFKQDRFSTFALAIVLFSLATSIFFTPLPIVLSHGMGLEPSMVYVAYILNSVGATAGYFLVGKRARDMDARKQVRRFVFIRSMLVFLLVGVVHFAIFPTIAIGLVLVSLGFAFGMYFILMLSLSMELIPAGKSGLFDVLVGLGAAAGSFLGPYLVDTLMYLPTFLIAGVLFLAAFIVLKIFT
jgi:predicted MFS family arabinose efflux permease